MSLHSELLAEARKRVRPANPTQAALRRAVSDAYYAVFHAIGAQVARPYPGPVRAGAKRTLDHSRAKTMANKIKSQQLLPAIGPLAPCPQLLIPVATYFCELQEARHVADYDERIDHTKGDVVLLIDKAEASLAALRLAEAQCPVDLYGFVLSLLFDRWQKQ